MPKENPGTSAGVFSIFYNSMVLIVKGLPILNLTLLSLRLIVQRFRSTYDFQNFIGYRRLTGLIVG